jgi:hypothetical protein
VTASEPRQRGVRLSDLDRSLEYRIAHTGRRWEVVGSEPPAGSAAPAQPAEPRVKRSAHGTGGGRHAAPRPGTEADDLLGPAG